MGVVYNRRQFGLFDNGDFELGNNTNFPNYTIVEGDVYSGRYCAQVNHTNQWVGSQFIPVDTSKFYIFSIRAKTVTRSLPNNQLGSFYTGFACYDQFYNFIDLRNCGGLGNTTLSRPLVAGDQYAYITSNSGWSTSTNPIFTHLMIFPATHPYYSTPHQYTRIGLGDFTICYDGANIFNTGTDFRLTLVNGSGTPITMPNVGYSLPTGTPVSNGQAGGTYNYVYTPAIPEAWTQYTTSPFTGVSRNSGLPFRFGTRFVKYMELSNFLYSSETTKAIYRVDNIVLIESPINRSFIVP
jgi:hypothetical protein